LGGTYPFLPGTAETQEVALLGLVVVLVAIVLDIRDLDYSECDVIEDDGLQDD